MVALSKIVASPANLAGISFPLPEPSQNPPLQFQPLEDLVELRRRQTQNNNRIPLQIQQLVTKPGAILSEILQPPETVSSLHKCAWALLFLGYGFTDECHDIITPLSWPDDIYFGAEPSQYHRLTSAEKTIATYIHALVHRREGFHCGEFGMMGFANAKYWSNAVHSVEDRDAPTLPYSEWKAMVVELASQEPFQSCPAVQEWCQEHGFTSSQSKNEWDARAIHELCANVMKKQQDTPTGSNEKSSSSSSSNLRSFAEELVTQEIRILLYHTLKQAGTDVQSTPNE